MALGQGGIVGRVGVSTGNVTADSAKKNGNAISNPFVLK
jgi:hypothetical protein